MPLGQGLIPRFASCLLDSEAMEVAAGWPER
jgi:hypothetical protein